MFLRFFNDFLDIKLTFLSRFVAFSVFFSQLLGQSCTSVVLRTVCGQCFEVACPKDQENHCMWHLFTGIFATVMNIRAVGAARDFEVMQDSPRKLGLLTPFHGQVFRLPFRGHLEGTVTSTLLINLFLSLCSVATVRC